MAYCSPTCSLISIVTSIFICLIGNALKGYLPNLVENTLMKNVVLTKTSMLYDFWVEPPVDVYTKFYVFNYTNHEEYVAKWNIGVQPKVGQLGPYVYRHLLRKTNISFSKDEVEYYEQEELVFIPELSNGTEEDVAIFPNVLLRGVVQSQMAKDDILAILTVLKNINFSVAPFVSKSVSSFILDGYQDPLIDEIYKLSGTMIVPDGLFRVTKRVSETGPIRMKTGANKTSDFGKIVEYENRKILDYWPKNSPCNLIRGTDGTIFPPRIPISERLFIFTGKFCRSIILRYEKQVEHHGVKANRFVLDTDTLSNTNLEYECFCQSTINKCWAVGLFNMGQCKNDTPILLSQPHFLNTDFRVKRLIQGLAPDFEKHQFFMDLETTISLPLNIRASLQLNIGIEPTPHIKRTNNLPPVILPILWISEVLDLNETMTAMIKSMIIDGPSMVINLVPAITLLLGAIIGFTGIACSIRHMFRATKKRDGPKMGRPIIHTFAY